MKIFKTVLCKKSLFKSTYNFNAFKVGKKYILTKEDNDFYFIRDETGHDFSFSKEVTLSCYWADDYFE